MTKEEYLDWLKTRGDAGTWEIEKCLEANKLIKATTLENLDKVLQATIVDETIRQFIQNMVCYQFGTGEVDELCMKLRVYPSWME